ncbi:hypothetical protein [Streptomyces chartreusis]|uniref:hypothetical protein n=1 Tax=Streptomyces chartreusis TaxID=1969 RepID=UPI001673EAAA|nr:hypothetical protein [Streptomyces chartreusis]
MDSHFAAHVASVEVLPVSGEFLISQVTFVVALLILASFAAFAVVHLSRKAGTGNSGENASSGAPVPGVTPASLPRSTHRWAIAGVVVAVLGLVIAAVELARGW